MSLSDEIQGKYPFFPKITVRQLEVEYVEFKIWNTAPDKPRQGRCYYADGTNWNPGSGEGLYLYTSGGYSKL